MTPLQDLLKLAHTLGSHPARLALWKEGSVGALLPNGNLAVSVIGANLRTLKETELVQFLPEKVRLLGENDVINTEELEEARAGGSPGGMPCTDLFVYNDLFAYEGIRFAAHTQPTLVNQILCSPRARQFADRRSMPYEILHCGISSLLVPFTLPGPALAKEVKRKILLWQDRFKGVPKVILIQNHGMIALGESPEEVLMITEMTLKFAQVFVGASLLGGPDFLKPTHIAQIDATGIV